MELERLQAEVWRLWEEGERAKGERVKIDFNLDKLMSSRQAHIERDAFATRVKERLIQLKKDKKEL